MPSLDVSEVLLDTDIAGDTFTVVRRLETVNQYGESTLIEDRTDQIGAVLPGPTPLQREGSFQTQPNQITVITSYRLRGVSKSADRNYQPDLILYGGNYFVVSDMSDFSAFGAGFIQATCDSIQYIDRASAPTTNGNTGKLDFTDPANFQGYPDAT